MQTQRVYHIMLAMDIKTMKNLPNYLTMARIAMIPVLVLVYPIDSFSAKVASAGLFLLASVTDYYDGYLARKYDLGTTLGEILDPIADKLLVCCCLILLAAEGVVAPWIVCLILSREFYISALRNYAAKKNWSLKVSQSGKVKTFFQDGAIMCLLINEKFLDINWPEVGMIGLWASIFFSLYSAYYYSQQFRISWREHETAEISEKVKT